MSNRYPRTEKSPLVDRAELILFHKPFGVLCQFSGSGPNLSDYIHEPGFYAAGRLDKDSEGLLLLTDNGRLQARIAEPRFKMEKTYWVQVEGEPTDIALKSLRAGVELKDGMTRPAKARQIDCPLPDRTPGIRVRRSRPTSWLEIVIAEGRNRQVRRMTAAVGLPTLRLFRARIGPWDIGKLAPGECLHEEVNFSQ